jgi:hypothetical protein
VLDLVAAKRAQTPEHEWYVHIYWDHGSADNYRSETGETVWMRTEPGGWVVKLVEDTMPAEGELNLPLVSGVKVAAQSFSGRSFPGGLIDVVGEELVITL